MTTARFVRFYIRFLENALSHHCLGNFHEAGNVCTLNIVDIPVGFCAVFHASGVDVAHDVVELLVNFFGCPVKTLGVLGHFETGNGNTARICCFARRI